MLGPENDNLIIEYKCLLHSPMQQWQFDAQLDQLQEESQLGAMMMPENP